MLLILEEAYKRQYSKGGSPLKCLSVLDKLIITLGYYREYRTMRHMRTTSKRMTVDKLCILLLLVVAAVDLNKDIVERLAAKLFANASHGAVSACCAVFQ